MCLLVLPKVYSHHQVLSGFRAYQSANFGAHFCGNSLKLWDYPLTSVLLLKSAKHSVVATTQYCTIYKNRLSETNAKIGLPIYLCLYPLKTAF